MKTSSAKAKGKRLCNWVVEKLYSWRPDLQPGDIRATSSGANGKDILLSPAAKQHFNLAIECKMQERINIWQSFEQACANVDGDEVPVVVFSKNRSDVLICMRFEDYMKQTL